MHARSEHEDQRDREEILHGVLEKPPKLAKVKLGQDDDNKVAKAYEGPRDEYVKGKGNTKTSEPARTSFVGSLKSRLNSQRSNLVMMTTTR